MEEFIVQFIVAAAVLFMIRWFVTNFTSKPEEDKHCGSCPSCETSTSKSEALTAPGHPVVK